jgi:3-deoxy-manno-octulosonate cytidylyltransferase (CMP-KDO synthetase)
MKIIAIIPARYDSSRFPGKPLVLLKGKSVIQHVFEKVQGSELFDQVIVATDNDQIYNAVKNFGGRVQMTDPRHKSGSDRVAEICADLDFDVVVNVQGDEPFIEKQPLNDLINCFQDPAVEIASLMHELTEDIENPNYVKVITDLAGDAIYFSRSPLPHNFRNSPITYFRHIGVYAFRKNALLEFISFPPAELEQIEKLEQLRLLENGKKIRMVKTAYSGFGIDTKADLQKAEKFLDR